MRKRSDLGLCPRDWSTRYCTNRRERPSLLDLLSEFGLISDGWLGSISPLGDWANALECWRSPSLRLVIPGIAVSPGVTHSDSRIVFVTGTVVKPQQPGSARYCTYRRERPSLLDLPAVRFRINFWLDGWGSISPLEIGPMHLSVEGLRPWDWSYPVLQYLREWPTPTVVYRLCHGYCR